jgi:hypothetical protein
MTAETRYTTRPYRRKSQQHHRLTSTKQPATTKSISIATDIRCKTQHTESSDSTQRAKQNDSTRNFNKSNQHHGTNTMAGQSRIQTVAGLHPSKTLVDTPKSPSTMAIHKRTAILNIQNYAKGYQDKHTGNHSPWQNPITSGINIQMKNCDKSQQHKRRPKPTTSITTHIAKMPKHATIKTNTYPEDHTQERSIRRCETRKKKS